MTTDLIDLIVRVNLALAAGIVLVLLLRAPMRRWFGARLAYALWLIPLFAALMCFAPARIEIVTLPAFPSAQPVSDAIQTAAPAPGPFDIPAVLLAVWAGGILLSLAVLALRQFRFVRGLGALEPRADWGADVYGAEGDGGPAVIGVIRPKIVAPADFERRYSEEERRVVLAHERAHLANGDPLINAAAALVQCVNWFNPLVHVAARALRVDQEFACDAAVLACAPAARRPYAEALLKTQTALKPVPLGCAWPSPTFDAFKERIAMMKNTPSRLQRLMGGAALTCVIGGVCVAAWAAQPEQIVVVAEERNEAMFELARLDQLDTLEGGPLARISLNQDDDHEYSDDQIDHDVDVDVDVDIDDDHEVSAEEIRIEVREALEEAREEMAEARRELDSHRAEMLAAGMSEDDIREIQRDVMAQARLALREAQAEVRVEIEHDSPAARELGARAQALASQAIELAAMSLEDEPIDEARRLALESQIDEHAERIEVLARQVQAEERAVRDRVRGERQRERSRDRD